MLIIPPPQSPKRRGRQKTLAGAPAGRPLMLVGASFDQDEFVLSIQFDRAINIDAIQTAQIMVKDGVYNAAIFSGGSAELIDSVMVVISLENVGPYAGEQQTLTATGLSGIVAVDDGGTWAGVTELGLPFP